VALGRYVRRDIQEFTNSYAQTVKLQGKAVREAARGLYNTPAQPTPPASWTRRSANTRRFGPRLRALIQTATPFLPWYLNAARFVFWTLPMKHPFKTAVLLAAEHAFSKDIADQHKDVPPGELKSAVPSGGGWLDLARFTPFGAFTAAAGGDYSQLFSPFFPQFQGVQKASGGLDPVQPPAGGAEDTRQPEGQRDRLRHPQGDGEQALEAFVPGLSPRGGSRRAATRRTARRRWSSDQDQARHGARLLRPRPPARPVAAGVPAPQADHGDIHQDRLRRRHQARSPQRIHTDVNSRLRRRSQARDCANALMSPYPQLLLLLKKPLVVEAGCPHG
jgi:hypothetical protein